MIARNILLTTIAVAFSATSLHADLIHQYKLDETSTSDGQPAEDSVGTLDGTYHGDVASVSGFLSGTAVQLDGSADGVQVSDSVTTLVGNLPDFTISAFFKPDTGFDSGDRFLYNESDALDGLLRPKVLFRLSGNTLQFGIHRFGSFNFATLDLSPTPLDTSTWYLAAATLSSSGGETVYLFDGITRDLIGSATNPNTLPAENPTSNATIGAWTGAGGFAGPQNSFIGSIDEVQLHNAALTQTEVAAIPEPGSISLIAAGGLWIAGRRRIRK